MESAFGVFLKSLRKSKKLTLAQLARNTGVSHSFLSQVENGKKGVPSIGIVFNLADALGVSRTDLINKAGYSVANNIPLPFNPATITPDHLEGLHEITADPSHNESFQRLMRNRDIKYYLTAEENEIFYNGVFLTKEERERIAKMLELLFPDKQ